MLLPVALVAASMLSQTAGEPAAPTPAAEPLVLPTAPAETPTPQSPATPPTPSTPSVAPPTGSASPAAAEPDQAPATAAAPEPAPTATPTQTSATPPAAAAAPSSVPAAADEPTPADDHEVPPSFQQWRMRAGLGVAAGLGNIVIGARFGVFVFDGLLVGIDLQQWTGKPAITGIGGELRYVFWMVPVVQPFVGVLYDHFFLWNGQPNAGFIGGRLGLVWVTKSGASAWLGGVYERAIKGCLDYRKNDSPNVTTCQLIYPELSVSLAF